MIDLTLVVIAKEPVAGRVKTRLCPPCSPEEAARLAEASLRDTLTVASEVEVRERMLVLEGAPPSWLPDGWRVEPQSGGGLADRLAAAFAAVRSWPALLVGMDTPQLTSTLLADSAKALCLPGREAVLGPTDDGGYWSIGLRQADPRVFAGIPMSTNRTVVAQRRRLIELGLRFAELPRLRDVDTIDDARAVAALAPWTGLAGALAQVIESCAAGSPQTAKL